MRKQNNNIPRLFLVLFIACLLLTAAILTFAGLKSAYQYFAVLTVLLAGHYFLFLNWIKGGVNIAAAEKGEPGHQRFISIVVPFRNEEKVIEANAESLLNQSYPAENYEIIYVDDNSTDDSCLLIAALRNGRLRLLSIANKNSISGGKKYALRYGIDNARGEIIVTADADCIYPNDWLKTMAAEFNDETGFAAGPVVYAADGTLFGEMQALEFAGLVLTGAGLIGRGMPTIANGANAAYRRDLFYAVGAFDSDKEIASGDDEMVMRKISRQTNYNVVFCGSNQAAVLARPSTDLKSFLRQRRRWASKSPFYDFYILTGMLLPAFLYFALLVVMILMQLIMPDVIALAALAAGFGLKMLGEYLVLLAGKRALNLNIRFMPLLLAVILHPFYIVYSTLAGVLLPFSWKERKAAK